MPYGNESYENRRKRREQWYRDQALRQGQTVGSVPGITGGQWVPNTGGLGAINGTPNVWQPPASAGGGAVGQAPAPAPVSSAQPGGYVAGGVPNLTGGYVPYQTSTVAPNVQTTAVRGPWNIPGTPAPGAPTTNNQGGQQGGGGGSGGGSGGNYYYSPSEYWDTLAAYSQDNWRGEGWYGSGGQYLGNSGGQGIGNADNPEAVYYGGDSRVYDANGRSLGSNIAFGNANYQGGQKKSWKQVVGDLIDSPDLDAQLAGAQQRLRNAKNGTGGAGGGMMGMMGLERAVKRLELAQKMRDKGWTFANGGGYQGGAGGGVGDNPTPNWMGQMVGFNP